MPNFTLEELYGPQGDFINSLDESKQELKKLAEKYFDECSKKYFSEYYKKFPIPPIKIVTNLLAKGSNAGKYVYGYNKKTFEIEDQYFKIDEDLSSNDEELKKTIYHETIHYYDVMIHGLKSFKNDISNKITKGHGDFFVKMMNTMNMREGGKFITVKLEVIPTEMKSEKEFYLYIVKADDNTYFACWSMKKDFDIIENIRKMFEKKDVQIFVAKSNYAPLKVHLFPATKSTKSYGLIDTSHKPEYISTMQTILKSSDVEKIDSSFKKPETVDKPYYLFMFFDDKQAIHDKVYVFKSSKFDDEIIKRINTYAEYNDAKKIYVIQTNSSLFSGMTSVKSGAKTASYEKVYYNDKRFDAVLGFIYKAIKTIPVVDRFAAIRGKQIPINSLMPHNNAGVMTAAHKIEEEIEEVPDTASPLN